MAAMGAGAAIAVMAVVTVYAAVGLNVEDGTKKIVVEALRAGSAELGTPAVWASEASGT